jgi:DNA-directed RNA polymerase subunit F
MEIINKNSALLSNFEVYKLLKETKEIQDLKYNKSINQQNIDKHLPTVVYESLKYLEKTACINYSKEIIEIFLKQSEKFKLTKVEKLQLLNQRPTTAVELQLLIENSEERFTIEQMDEILDFINNLLPGITKEEEEEQQQIEGEEGENLNE